MDSLSSRIIRIVLYISLLSTIVGAMLATQLFTIPMPIAIFFGGILGFFIPWVVALLLYSIYAMSNPTIAFKNQLKKEKKIS
jgi:uncharacterized membrane protein